MSQSPVLEYSTEPVRLQASYTGARGELTMASLETRLIAAATRHADLLGVGFNDIIKLGRVWVLSRMTIEMKRMPRINDVYSVTTWIESFNRHLSERNFAVLDADGAVMGYARSVWASIDVASRRPAALGHDGEWLQSRPCPIERPARLQPVENPDRIERHTYNYSDIDFNRHVNSARYVEMMANCFPLDFHLARTVRRIDIAYLHESLFGQEAEIRIAQSTESDSYDIEARTNGISCCRARVDFLPRDPDGFMEKMNALFTH